MNATTYDSKCYDLADDFLFDHPHINTGKHCEELASHIQLCIESWLADKLENYCGPDDPAWLKNAKFCGND